MEKIKEISEYNKKTKDEFISYRCILVGASGSGKSFNICRLLEYEKKHHNAMICVFTPKQSSKPYEKITELIYNEDNPEEIMNRISEIEAFIEKNEKTLLKKRKIIVFDDIISPKLMQNERFLTFWCSSRHFNINILYVCHHFSVVILPIIKNNSTHFWLFKIGEIDTIKTLCRKLLYDIVSNLREKEEIGLSKCFDIYDKYITRKNYGNILVSINDKKMFI